MTPLRPTTLDARIQDLIHQATTEKSHFYIATILTQCMQEITRLREYEWMYKDLEK